MCSRGVPQRDSHLLVYGIQLTLRTTHMRCSYRRAASRSCVRRCGRNAGACRRWPQSTDDPPDETEGRGEREMEIKTGGGSQDR